MKKFVVYLLVIVLVVSLGFGIFYLVRDNEVISISSASIYKDAKQNFTLDVMHANRKGSTSITISSSDDSIVSIKKYDRESGKVSAYAENGGVARINVRTTNAKFRNLWCDVIVGDGSVESPYYISTVEQLAAIGMGKQAEDAEGNKIPGVYEGATGYEHYRNDLCYKLVTNIDASAINGYWVPLQRFNGRFDGNGFTISNVYIDYEGYQANVKNPNPFFVENCDAGIFASVGKDAVVYNFKVENFAAVGEKYGKFGVIAGVNYGTIERIEVKDAYLSVRAGALGGLVGVNQSTVRTSVITTDNGQEEQVKSRAIARIDRTSVNNMVMGEKRTTSPSGEAITTVLGVTGTVGGLVGINEGGTIVYSYAKGKVYFAKDDSLDITYGGLIGENKAIAGMPYNKDNKEDSEYQGANIKDCYASISTHITKNENYAKGYRDSSMFGGAIGINRDYSHRKFDDTNDKVVNNYIIGVYYNKDLHNASQDGITKNFLGIGKFYVNHTTVVGFAEGETIVKGLGNETEIKTSSNFVSHKTLEVVFNEDGTSKGIAETKVLWLFGSVWAISETVNDGMPYLSYQLSYIPDDFETVGDPIVTEANDKYYYDITIDYPVTILSGEDGKVRIKVGEYYQLVYSPTGIEVKWESANPEVVTVDPNTGILKGIKAGVASVTATNAKTGSQASVTVIVEDISYSIIAPESIHLYVNQTYNLGDIDITPATSEQVTYTVANTNIATVTGGVLKGAAAGETTVTISVRNSSVVVPVKVEALPQITLTAGSSTTIAGHYSIMAKTGSIVFSATGASDISYSCSIVTGNGVVVANMNGSTFNYTIKSVGNATVRVLATGKVGGQTVSAYRDVYFVVKGNQDVVLTMSPKTVSGYYSTIAKTGTITISNSAGIALNYDIDSNNKTIVEITNKTSNQFTYKINAVGNALITINVTTANYTGSGYVQFYIYKDPEVVIPPVVDPDDSTVDPPVVTPTDSLTVTPFNVTTIVGMTSQLEAKGSYSSLTWTSDDPHIATVNSTGLVTGISAGRTVVTARTSNGVEAKVNVTVNAKEVVSINVNPSNKNMLIGETCQLVATGNFSKVTWKSYNETVATVSSTGLVTAIGKGSTKLVATAQDSEGRVAYAYPFISVNQQVTLSLIASSTSIVAGDTVNISAITNDSTATINFTTASTYTRNGNNITIKTDSNNYNDIVVSATANNGTTATAKITIKVSPNTAYSPYIYNLGQLNAVRYNLDKEYFLAADINVGDWTPITGFTGSLTSLANGSTYYKLTNVKVNAGNGNAGLFATLTNRAKVENLIIENSSFAGNNAGAIAGCITGDTNIINCKVSNTAVTGNVNAGGLVGQCITNGILMRNTLVNNTITVKANNGNAGGIIGDATEAYINNCSITGGSVQATGSAGKAGGIIGDSKNSLVSNKTTISNVSVSSSTKEGGYAGGVVGITNGRGCTAFEQSVENTIVSGCTVSGYYAGGIGGAISSSQSISLTFSNYKSGFRAEDLSSSSYKANITKVAVKSGTVKGVMIGGLFGEIRSGVVENCYTRVQLYGTDGESIKGGFASTIQASSVFNNNGGTGTAGLVRYCYSACTFAGSGDAYAITSSLVHNYGAANNGSGRAGYVMNYLFDDDIDGKATYHDGSNIFSSDKVQARKSTSDMKKASIYSDKGFSSTTWKLTDGNYMTLKFEG